MPVLDDHFERISLMTLDPSTPRARRAIGVLSKFSNKFRIVKGVRGDDLPHPPGYRAGNGAWGCLQTHVRIAQDAWLDEVENYLVLEDDVVFDPDFETLLPQFMRAVPENWDQIYLGGQHRSDPRWVNDAVYDARQINRTHAFALRRGIIPEFLKHVLDMRDHFDAKWVKHIDHRLEDAHLSRRWVTYAPSWWLVGQGENQSGINGKWHPNKWWDHNPGWSNKLPLINVDREPTPDELKCLHFGWADRPDGKKYIDPFFLQPPRDPGKGVRIIQQEAFECRRLAGVATFEHDFDPTPYFDAWEAPVIALSTNPDLAQLCDYPRNGSFKHRWVNP